MALSLDSFHSQRTIYSIEGSVEVCKAYSTYHGRPVCIKIIPIARVKDMNAVLQEVILQSTVQHPNICKVFDCFVSGELTNLRAVIVLEEMEKDLLTVIQERRAEQCFWSEEELWSMFQVLVQTFAFLRTLDISHRDVKPNNILVSATGILKLCDFGTSKRFYVSQAAHTLKGTKPFMSPALKSALNHDQFEVDHDPFKSDVYSLGLTFLSMARLVPPLELQVAEEKLNSAVKKTVSQLRYSKDIKGLIASMLEVEEEQRPDFDALKLSFTLIPALKTLNSPLAKGNDIENALKVVFSVPISLKISKTVPCTSCKSNLDLCSRSNSLIFCECGLHCYCNLTCYYAKQGKEEGFQEVDRKKARCGISKVANCLLCACEIVGVKEEVRLVCDPENHLFCSCFCLNRFVQERSSMRYSSGEQIRCPKCDVKINEEILIDLYQTKEQYYKVIKRECMKCHSKKFRFLTKCGHAFCKPCTLELRNSMDYLKIKEMACPLCAAMLTKIEVKTALSVKRHFRNFLNFIIS